MKIRNANTKDCPTIAKLHIDSWKAAYKNLISASYLNNLDVKARTNTLEKVLSKSSCQIIVIEDNDEMMGFVLFGKSRDYPESNHTAEIWAIYITPEYYGKGYGYKLLAEAENILVSNNFKTSTLWVLEANTQTVNFYSKHDYKNTGKFKIMEKLGNLIAIEMIKKLNIII